MNEIMAAGPVAEATLVPDSGLACVCAIAGYFRIMANPAYLSRELAIGERETIADDLLRAAKFVGMKARFVSNVNEKRLRSVPVPAIVRDNQGRFLLLAGRDLDGTFRIFMDKEREFLHGDLI